MIKYFIHLSNPICTGIVAEAFEESGKLHLENKRSWYRNITEVIDYFGMDKCKIFNLKSTLKNYIHVFQCLCMKYKNTWKSVSYLKIRDIIHAIINLEHIDYLKISLFLNRI